MSALGQSGHFTATRSITSSARVGIVMSSCGGYLAHIFRRRRSLASWCPREAGSVPNE